MALDRIFLTVAGIFGGTAVAAGAFASHALRGQLSERLIGVFETGVRYQMYHALALLMVALLMQRGEGVSTWLVVTGWAFVSGVLIFSGSLYALSLSQIKILGAVAPLGGLTLMIGWGCLVVSALVSPKP